MKNFKPTRLIPTAGLLLLTGTFGICTALSSCRRYNGKEAEQKRQEWKASLQDSIKQINRRCNEDSMRLTELYQKVEGIITDFTTVENPREVEPYYIYTPWKGKYPLTSTGLCARLMKNEKLELIAASKSRFSAIRVTVGQYSCETDVVPPDQALNYTANGLTTVSFTGEKADSVARLIADNYAADEGIPVKVEYLDPRVTGTLTLSPSAAQMIRRTYQLFDTQETVHRLEKDMTVGRHKIEILNRRIAMEEAKEKDKETK